MDPVYNFGMYLEHLTPLERTIYLTKEAHPDLSATAIARMLSVTPAYTTRTLRKLALHGVYMFRESECRAMESMSPEERVSFLIKNWKEIPYRYHHLLSDVDMEPLPPFHRYQKLLFQFQVEMEDPEIILKEVKRLEDEYLQLNLRASYYRILTLRLLIYNFMGKKDLTWNIYTKNRRIIEKLPYNIANDFYDLALNAAVYMGKIREARNIARILETYIESKRGSEDRDVREYLTDFYINDGNFRKAMKIAEKDSFHRYRLLRFTGRYKELLKAEPPEVFTGIEKFYIALDRAYSLAMTGSPVRGLLTLLPAYAPLENKYTSAMRNFHLFMATYHAVMENAEEKEANLKKAIEFSEGLTRKFLQALLQGHIEDYAPTKYLSITKDWIEGRINRAIERGTKFEALWVLHTIALFLPKPLSRIERYPVMEPVYHLMKLPRLKLLIFNEDPLLIYRGEKYPITRGQSNLELIKIILNGGEVESERLSQNHIRIFRRKFGKGFLRKKGNKYILNARIDSDYFRFLELYRSAMFYRKHGMEEDFQHTANRLKRLYRCHPFRKLSFRDSELDAYRTRISIMASEIITA